MLGLKSFRTAEITLAGIELAHRIRKGQFSVGDSVRGGCCSLKQQWDLALTRGHADPRPIVLPETPSTVVAPELKHHRAVPLTETWVREIKSLRYARKISDGCGLRLRLRSRDQVDLFSNGNDCLGVPAPATHRATGT
jgi:erythromycin esterase-like protein